MLDKNPGRVFDYVVTYQTNRRQSPSFREIAEACDLSERTVSRCMETLQACGYLERRGTRAIRILKTG